ncbi:HTTM domain-containing protein [Sinomonas mesophila]|uniref:HTTM domain-containing protein n=1 Tax=Sinomonas mesophila TaxID=1531955 RepID=UPI0009844971|nr:HTTM domain-containing protein [Sinomonas mesophila]
MLQFVNRDIDARPLALARIIIGLASFLLPVEWLKPMLRVASGDYLALPVFDGLPSVPTAAVYGLFAVSLLGSAAMVMGIFGGLPALAVAACSAIVLLADQQVYSNHFLLLVMLCTFIGLSGASKAMTVLRPKATQPVPYWPAFLIKAQITTLYAWTAISKVNPQYLSGDVLADQLRPWVPVPDSLLPAVAVTSIVVEAFLAVALWLPRTRLLAFIAGFGLHVGILVLLLYPGPLISFAMLMSSGYVLFAHESLVSGQWRIPGRGARVRAAHAAQ